MRPGAPAEDAMARFEPQLWRSRAWRRFETSLRRGTPTRRAEETWTKDVGAVGDLEVLVAWTDQRGIAVDFVRRGGGTYSSLPKGIVVSGRLSPTRQVAVLLHECGHHLVTASDGTDRFGAGYVADETIDKRTDLHKLACLEEEMEAWHRGWRLKERLGLSLLREDFDGMRVECLKTYVTWIAGRSRGGDA